MSFVWMKGRPMVHTTLESKRKGELTVDPKRAKEIAISPIMANVTHNGVPVYIERGMEDSSMANIHHLNKPSIQQTVSISSLTEH